MILKTKQDSLQQPKIYLLQENTHTCKINLHMIRVSKFMFNLVMLSCILHTHLTICAILQSVSNLIGPSILTPSFVTIANSYYKEQKSVNQGQ